MAEAYEAPNQESSDWIPVEGDLIVTNASVGVSPTPQQVPIANDDGELGSSEGTVKGGAGILVPFSVYTAKNGYDWSSIPEGIDRDVLDYYYKKSVQYKPDFMATGDVVKGVAAYGGYLAAFRIQMVKRWDEFGRDADYCSFAFIDYENAKFVDFEALLEMPEFIEPRRNPPSYVHYNGNWSKDINSEGSISDIKRLYSGESLRCFDFAKIGALISEHGTKSSDWLFCKVESAVENSTTVTTGIWQVDPYPPPSPPPPTPPPVQLPTSVFCKSTWDNLDGM